MNRIVEIAAIIAQGNGYRTPLFYDTFTAVDGTQITARAPDIGVSWTLVESAPVIYSNALRPQVGINYSALANATLANVKITAVFTTGQSTGAIDLMMIMARATNINNYWACLFGKNTSSDYSILEVNGGVATTRASGTYVYAPNTTYNAIVTVSGQSITFGISSLTTISYAGAALNETVDRHGVRCIQNGTITNRTSIDNYKIEAL